MKIIAVFEIFFFLCLLGDGFAKLHRLRQSKSRNVKARRLGRNQMRTRKWNSRHKKSPRTATENKTKGPVGVYGQQIVEPSEDILDSLEVDGQELLIIKNEFKSEMEKGMPNKPERDDRSLHMLYTFVDLPSETKRNKVAFAIDWGGSTLRVLRVDFGVDGTPLYKPKPIQEFIPSHLMLPDTSVEELFDHVAGKTAEFVDSLSSDEELENDMPFGFTFSFPLQQTAKNKAILLKWTKGFRTGQNTERKLTGEDVVEELQNAFKRRNLLNARIKVINNDTVGTMITANNKALLTGQPKVKIGVILGTGFNACYVDRRLGEGRWEGNIINIELGRFGKKLRFLSIDEKVDQGSPNPGKQRLEKMVSGLYLGELCQLAIREAYPNVRDIDVLTSAKAAQLIASKPISQKDIHERRICEAVFRRSARLAAGVIAGIIEKTYEPEEKATVAFDGSVYLLNDFYRENLKKAVGELLPGYHDIEFVNSADGSGLGAAILAAHSWA